MSEGGARRRKKKKVKKEVSKIECKLYVNGITYKHGLSKLVFLTVNFLLKLSVNRMYIL
jgi:hypothetical protein